MEMLDLYNAKGERLGRSVERGEWKATESELVKIIHVFVMNEKGETLIQQRAFTKKVWPGQWTILGGFVVSGEEPEEAVIRETAEEYGVDISNYPRRMICRMVRELRGCIMEFWMVTADISVEDVVRQCEEVEAVTYATPERLLEIYSQHDRWRDEDDFYRNHVLDLMAHVTETYLELISDV